MRIQLLMSDEPPYDTNGSGTSATGDDNGDIYAAQDPWEHMNRKVHAFNTGVDRLFARPLARGYVKAVPAEKLLVFTVDQGWEPLCRFLGLPVPATPFPNVNDRAEIKKVMTRLEDNDGSIFGTSPAGVEALGIFRKAVTTVRDIMDGSSTGTT